MIRWWLKSGVWWLAGIVLLSLADRFIISGAFPLHPSITFTVMAIINSTNYFLPLLLVVVAASVCDGFIFDSYEQHAAPMPKDILWGRYLLALGQVIPLAVTISIVSTVFGIYQLASGQSPNGECPVAIWIVTTALSGLSGYALSIIWLVLFVVLAANMPVLKYGLLVASFIASLLGSTLYLTIMISLDYPFSYLYSESRWLSLYALPLWLLLAIAMKQNKYKPAIVLQVVISVSIISNMTIVSMYGHFGGSFLKGIAFATEVINAPYHSYSQVFPPMLPLPGSGLNPEETLLGYLPFLLKPLMAWINPCILLGIIYLFVFSSIPQGWVENLKARLFFPR